MAFLDIFKKKKKGKEKKEKPSKKEKKPLEEEKIVGVTEAPKKKAVPLAHQILYSPHITEKAAALGEKNSYVFKIWPLANKTEIKKTVEGIYGVNVIGIKIINIPRKQRRLRRQTGWRKGYKKAIVKVKEGQKIEILPR